MWGDGVWTDVCSVCSVKVQWCGWCGSVYCVNIVPHVICMIKVVALVMYM